MKKSGDAVNIPDTDNRLELLTMVNLPRTTEAYRCWWESNYPAIPYGLCLCGCGAKTRLAPVNSTEKQWIKNEPKRYLRGHGTQYTDRRFIPDYIEEDRGHKTPCWIWKYSCNKNGYGQTTVNGKRYQAHRIYFEKKYGPIPEGLYPDHLCRVRPCINPKHIELVTHAINCQRGSNAKLDHQKAAEIRRLHFDEGVSQRGLARLFRVNRTTIKSVLYGTGWQPID